MSAVAWYEFSRGPRTPEQLAVARGLFLEEGIVPFSEELASCAADAFRRLGSPRKRAGTSPSESPRPRWVRSC